MKLRTLHRASAAVIVAFALVHIANHLLSLWSVSAHIAFMKTARAVYRLPVVETILLSCVAFQAVSGLCLVIRGWKQRHGLAAWLQACSGLYLALFFLVHVSAVLYGRAVLFLDTNFYFAAAGFHVPPNQYFFAPYYFLAVVALFTHIGCAAYWHFPSSSRAARKIAVILPPVLGSVIGLLIVLSLAGKIQPVEIPLQYKAIYVRNAG